jgi:hypothetical protein
VPRSSRPTTSPTRSSTAPRATWLRLLHDAGFTVEIVRRPIGDGDTDEIFVCRRPMGVDSGCSDPATAGEP